MAWIFGPSEQTVVINSLIEKVKEIVQNREECVKSKKINENKINLIVNNVKEENKDTIDSILTYVLYQHPVIKLKEVHNNICAVCSSEIEKIKEVNRIIQQLEDAFKFINTADNSTEDVEKFILRTLLEKDVLVKSVDDETSSTSTCTFSNISFSSFMLNAAKEYLLQQSHDHLKEIVVNADGFKKIAESKELRKKEMLEMRRVGCVKNKVSSYIENAITAPQYHSIVHTNAIVIPKAFEEKMAAIFKEKQNTVKKETELESFLNAHTKICWDDISADTNLINHLDKFSKKELDSLNKDIVYDRCSRDMNLAIKMHAVTKKYAS